MGFGNEISGPRDDFLAEHRRLRKQEIESSGSARDAAIRASAVARAEAARLGYEGDAVSDPGAAADWIENNPQYGPEEIAPGWANAGQYAAAAKAFDPKGQRSPTEVQHLMSPEKYEYMQNVGRTVDLLRSLADKGNVADGQTSAERAMYWWDRSNNARSTRDDYGNFGVLGSLFMGDRGANYQRYGGGSKGVGAMFTNPLSPINAHIQNMEVLPNALAFATETSSAHPMDVGLGVPLPAPEAMARAGALHGLRQRVATGENPILDIEPRRDGESPEEYAARYATRLEELRQLEADARQPSDQYVANAMYGTPVPRFTADIIGTARSMVDPTFWGSVLTGAPIAAGKGGLLRKLFRSAADEAKPEAAFAAGVNYITGGSGSPTWGDYFFTPVDTSPEERAAIRDQDHKARVQAQVDALNRENPTLWESVHGKGVLSGLGIAENPQLWTGPQDDQARARARR